MKRMRNRKFYKCGQRFCLDDGAGDLDTMILAQLEGDDVVLICMEDGNRWSAPFKNKTRDPWKVSHEQIVEEINRAFNEGKPYEFYPIKS